MRLFAALLVVLALMGASTECLAECLSTVKVPPCHGHAEGQDNVPADSCRHPQLIAHKQPPIDHAIADPADLPAPIDPQEVTSLQVTRAIDLRPEIDRPPDVLRL